MSRFLFVAMIFFVGASVSAPAAVLPAPAVAMLPAAEYAGSAEARWMLWSVYTVELWNRDLAAKLETPYALGLRYARNFSREQIVETSLDEMKRQGASEASLAKWGTALTQIFPNVVKGDLIYGVALKDETVFYRGDALLGRIADPSFSHYFFGIWLAPSTRLPQVREQLLAEAAP